MPPAFLLSRTGAGEHICITTCANVLQVRQNLFIRFREDVVEGFILLFCGMGVQSCQLSIRRGLLKTQGALRKPSDPV
eukprot:240513-Rhodomonas_salina.3